MSQETRVASAAAVAVDGGFLAVALGAAAVHYPSHHVADVPV